jgi:hypothetical protein
MVIDFYKDASVVGTERQVDLEKLPNIQRDAAVEDLLETITVLDKMLEETKED